MFVGASVSWEHDRVNISEFRVQFRIDDDNFETLTTASPSITIRDIRAGNVAGADASQKLPESRQRDYDQHVHD